MPRQILTPTVSPGPLPTAAAVVTETAENTSDNSRFAFTGKELLIVHNTDVGAQTFTVTSVADEQGRLGHITTEAIAAGAWKVLGPFTTRPGWRQSDGYVYCSASHIGVKFAVIRYA